MDAAEREALMKLHHDLPRQGPGSDATTLRAISAVPHLPEHPRVIDAGCGPGSATIVLARELGGNIVSIDMQAVFLEELKHRAAAAGVLDRVEARVGDMANLNAPDESLDLIWAEGSIYCIGFDNGLKKWWRALRMGGSVACTELSWLVDEPSAEPRSFWNENYPGMRSFRENILAAESLGYACVDHFDLPSACWWLEYYDPLYLNMSRLSPEAQSNPYLDSALKNMQTEIHTYEKYSREYGYVFYILTKSPTFIRRAAVDDVTGVAQVFRNSRKHFLPYLPDLHTSEEDMQFLKTQVFPNNEVFVSCDRSTGQITGFVAFDSDHINHLYLDPSATRQGVGTRLLNIAKLHARKLQLWTFQKNEGARRFYEQHGFKSVRFTAGDNDEKEPDVLLEWVAGETQR